jgi:hypothetical protein
VTDLFVAFAPSTKIDKLFPSLVSSRVVIDSALRFYRAPCRMAKRGLLANAPMYRFRRFATGTACRPFRVTPSDPGSATSIGAHNIGNLIYENAQVFSENNNE